MKQLLTVILLAIVAIAARSQEPAPQLRQLEQHLQELGYNVSHTQSSGTERGITHQWSALLTAYIIHPQSAIDSTKSEAWNRRVVEQYDSINRQRRQMMVHALDSIRLTFARLGRDASESYLYEYHKNGTDTIKYSLAFRRDNDTLQSFRIDNNVYFRNAIEVASFDYTHRNDNDDHGATDWGNYNHLYTIPSDITWNGMQPFDYAAFEALIAPALKAAKKLKGVKAYPVYWRHDEGFDDELGPEGNLISKTVRYNGNTSKHYGLTTGTCYFIPKQHEEEANALYLQLDSLAHDFVDRHPEQYYTYVFSSGFFQKKLLDMLMGLDIKGDSSYELKTLADDDGFYILSINTRGELWIPRDWPRLKSYVNGERVYLKGMKP